VTDQTSTTGPAAIEQLVRENLPLVGYLVRELFGRLPSHLSRDDLTSAGLAALAYAAKAFDPQRGVGFSSFASIRIRGALLDELRGQDWASRSVRARARQVDKVQGELAVTLGRSATRGEIAASMGVTVGEVGAVVDDVQRAMVLSLQGFADGQAEHTLPESGLGPEELLLHREELGYLQDAVAALPERLRVVVTRYFLEDEPMATIAADLGVTESRVSQLRAEALALLKDGLNAQLDPEKVTGQGRPGGCVDRRREAYYSAVAAQGTLRSRLQATSPLGLPVQLTA
jgi:RNA polymerase sigma factor for flagellar operon FliA